MHKLNISNNLNRQKEILSNDALVFLSAMVDKFTPERDRLLKLRETRQQALNDGMLPGFCAQSRDVRNADWQVAPIPVEAQDRRTEITGPVSRKMVINALNSGAQVFMADFEDATAPSWANVIEGQINLRDAVDGTISFDNGSGKHYSLNEHTALLMVRPRGWHLTENHVEFDGRAIPASLFDFALFLFHNHAAIDARGIHPYFYLPKLEHYLEARLWDSVIAWSETELGIEPGTVKVTVLIETLAAAFQMDEILYELRTRIQGLNCGRWDYIFSYIKSLRNHPGYLFQSTAGVNTTRSMSTQRC